MLLIFYIIYIVCTWQTLCVCVRVRLCVLWQPPWSAAGILNKLLGVAVLLFLTIQTGPEFIFHLVEYIMRNRL